MAQDQAAVEHLLSAARAAVDAANIPADLRLIAFTKALDLLAGAPAAGAQAGHPATVAEKTSNHATPSSGGSTLPHDVRLAKIAQRAGADATKLPYVYDLDDDDVTLIVMRSKLTGGDAAATRELALLYCAARQAGGYDAQTKVELVRKRADDMGVLDVNNFAAHLKIFRASPSRAPGAHGNTRSHSTDLKRPASSLRD